jgi:hypothetical protein
VPVYRQEHLRKQGGMSSPLAIATKYNDINGWES